MSPSTRHRPERRRRDGGASWLGGSLADTDTNPAPEVNSPTAANTDSTLAVAALEAPAAAGGLAVLHSFDAEPGLSPETEAATNRIMRLPEGVVIYGD